MSRDVPCTTDVNGTDGAVQKGRVGMFMGRSGPCRAGRLYHGPNRLFYDTRGSLLLHEIRSPTK